MVCKPAVAAAVVAAAAAAVVVVVVADDKKVVVAVAVVVSAAEEELPWEVGQPAQGCIEGRVLRIVVVVVRNQVYHQHWSHISHLQDRNQ